MALSYLKTSRARLKKILFVTGKKNAKLEKRILIENHMKGERRRRRRRRRRKTKRREKQN